MSSLYQSQYHDESLTEYVLKSVGLHAILVILILSATYLMDLNFSSQRDANLVLVEGSVRVDVVAMPRMTVKELRQLETGTPTKVVETPKPAPAPVPKVADDSKAPVLETTAAPKENVMDVLKRAAAKKIDAPAAADTTDNKLSNEAQKRLRELVVAGNRLSGGSSVVGSGQGSDMTAFNLYISALPDLVRPHWRLPSYLMDQGLKARVRIFIQENGALVRAEVHQSSGNSEYDQRALDAVRASSPFPRLSDEIKHRVIRGEILLGFPL